MSRVHFYVPYRSVKKVGSYDPNLSRLENGRQIARLPLLVYLCTQLSDLNVCKAYFIPLFKANKFCNCSFFVKSISY